MAVAVAVWHDGRQLLPWEAHTGAPHSTRCAPSHHPPHLGAAQVGLGVPVLAQVLAAQVLERVAGGRTCGPARCDMWGRSEACTWLRPMHAAAASMLAAAILCVVSLPSHSPPPPETASAGAAGSSSVAAAAALSSAAPAASRRLCGVAAHCTLQPTRRLLLRCCLKHCRKGAGAAGVWWSCGRVAEGLAGAGTARNLGSTWADGVHSAVAMAAARLFSASGRAWGSWRCGCCRRCHSCLTIAVRVSKGASDLPPTGRQLSLDKCAAFHSLQVRCSSAGSLCTPLPCTAGVNNDGQRLGIGQPPAPLAARRPAASHTASTAVRNSGTHPDCCGNGGSQPCAPG